MSIPLIASVSEDSIRAVPHELREAALGIGATKWQTTLSVLLPAHSQAFLQQAY
jgi:phosphate transport system permease protein